MTPPLIGAAIGLLVGIVSWRTLSIVATRVDKPDTRRLLGIVGGIELILMPVLGYVIGLLAFGDAIQGVTP